MGPRIVLITTRPHWESFLAGKFQSNIRTDSRISNISEVSEAH